MPVKFIFSRHALLEMKRRQIDEAMVLRVLKAPEQEEYVRPGRKVFQSKIQLGEPRKTYLLRVFVDVDRKPPEVVTVYKTSKLKKYWRGKN
ncbi:DUF4258 domain-containing protein [Desulfofundulus thermosubterraneus]|uniref:DUF4258 domain-containing protein n=1 Tax=Desulfofundulus thermosubterraneus TaxID=348840 RepID=UPI0009351596